jgi:hypothetical protein
LEFFMPCIEDAEKAEGRWRAIKAFAQDTTGWQVGDERIRRLEYVHDGKEWTAEVGEPHPYGHPPSWDYAPDLTDPRAGEYVIAILKSNALLVCTLNRGVERGQPILVGLDEVRQIEHFAGYGPGDI